MDNRSDQIRSALPGIKESVKSRDISKGSNKIPLLVGLCYNSGLMEKKTEQEGERKPAEAKACEQKRPYRAPKLIEHGSITSLTQFGGSLRAFDFFARRF